MTRGVLVPVQMEILFFGEFFRLSFGIFFRVSVSGVEAGRKEGKEVRKVQKRRQTSGTS